MSAELFVQLPTSYPRDQAAIDVERPPTNAAAAMSPQLGQFAVPTQRLVRSPIHERCLATGPRNYAGYSHR